MNPLSISTNPGTSPHAGGAPVSHAMNRSDGPISLNTGAAGRTGLQHCCNCIGQAAFYSGVIGCVTATPVLCVLRPEIWPAALAGSLSVFSCCVVYPCIEAKYGKPAEQN